MRRIAAALIVLTGALAEAQSPAIEFDVASIKRSPPDAVTSMRRLPDGQLMMTNRPLVVLLEMAWPESAEFTGLPSWMNTEPYDVVVKPRAGAPAAQLPEMYRNLLATRMKFAFHAAPKEVPSFALVVDRADGRLGPGLTPSQLSCDGAVSPTPRGATPQDRTAAAAASCDLRFWMESNIGRMVSGGAPLDQLARQLGQSVLLRPVTNETGLPGRFAFDLRFVRPAGAADDTSSDRPDLRTALREQLGLRIQASRTTVQTLVIDHIERPSEN